MTTLEKLWPEPGAGAAWGHWTVVAERLGADFPLSRPLLLGLRGARPFRPEYHPIVIAPSYDDSFVLISASGVTVFPGATHAYQKRSRASPDADGDGAGDVATIKEGRYLMRRRSGKYPVFEITTRGGSPRIPCYRDLRHDGTLADGGFFATDILFHWGYNAAADSDHKSSIGCQTCDLPYLQIMAAECQKYGGTIDYILQDAGRVAGLCDDLRGPDTERNVT